MLLVLGMLPACHLHAVCSRAAKLQMLVAKFNTSLADVFEIVHPKLCLHALHNTADKTAQSGSADEFLDLARQDTFCGVQAIRGHGPFYA